MCVCWVGEGEQQERGRGEVYKIQNNISKCDVDKRERKRERIAF